MTLAVIIVDHGSRRDESNRLLTELATLFASKYADRFPIVESAHMELAEPSISTAFARCIDRGAGRVVVMPFFLGPGKHWNEDIPRLVQAAAARFPRIETTVTEPLGIHDLLLRLIATRIDERLAATVGSRGVVTPGGNGAGCEDFDDAL
jgi:sirohydrochlorin ferrochelatase